MNATLVKPTPALHDEFLALLRDYAAAGEQFRHGQLHATARHSFDRYLQQLREWSRGEGLQPGWVPHDMYWLVDRGRIVGETTLRHFLVPELMHEGGHIGYRITPGYRRRGYGRQILAQMLEKARRRGLPRVLLTCDTDNQASGRIIRRNGGIFENEVTSRSSGKPVSRYWIPLDARLDAGDRRETASGEPAVLDKVTVFLTSGEHLLLLHHPTGGIQLPAGTVETYESYSNAAWRELYEESGVARARLATKLGGEETVLQGDQRCLLRTELLSYQPGGHAVTFKLQRGSWVREVDRFGAYSKVVYEENDVTTGRSLLRRDGWVATRYLSRRTARHFFHMICCQEMPDSWNHHADGHGFMLRWAPLVPRPRLVTPQDAWLARYWEALREVIFDR